MGSSPRVRGKAVRARLTYQQGRIIPAGAGKSLSGALSQSLLEDHPRGCGEKKGRSAQPSKKLGSSPRVRGKAEAARYLRDDLGIIPAGAGKSSQSPQAAFVLQDHPRGCGEKL